MTVTHYINVAMRHLSCEPLVDGTWYCEIPSCPGVWSNEDTLEAARKELHSVLGDWITLGLERGHPLPVIDGLATDG